MKENLNSLEKEKEKLLDTVDDLEHKVKTSEEDIEQFDLLKDKLVEVKDEEPIGFPFGVPNTAPIQTLPFLQPYNPYNPYTINCGSGSSGTITTTPGVGSITIGNPPFGFGSTSTAYGYPSGSAWSYTKSNERIF